MPGVFVRNVNETSTDVRNGEAIEYPSNIDRKR